MLQSHRRLLAAPRRISAPLSALMSALPRLQAPSTPHAAAIPESTVLDRAPRRRRPGVPGAHRLARCSHRGKSDPRTTARGLARRQSAGPGAESAPPFPGPAARRALLRKAAVLTPCHVTLSGEARCASAEREPPGARRGPLECLPVDATSRGVCGADRGGQRRVVRYGVGCGVVQLLKSPDARCARARTV